MFVRARISKEFLFEASHVLPNHSGKCSRLHGHNYHVVVKVVGPIRIANGSSSEGMVMDFGELKVLWKGLCEPSLDHRHLNDTLPVDVPTAENIAAWIFSQLNGYIGEGRSIDLAVPMEEVALESVTVWETDGASAEVGRG